MKKGTQKNDQGRLSHNLQHDEGGNYMAWQKQCDIVRDSELLNLIKHIKP